VITNHGNVVFYSVISNFQPSNSH